MGKEGVKHPLPYIFTLAKQKTKSIRGFVTYVYKERSVRSLVNLWGGVNVIT